MKVITQDHNLHNNFAIILELTDEELNFITDNPERFLTLDLDLMRKLMLSKGNNAHVIQLTLNEDVKILRYASKLLKIYDSVSWFNRDHEFHIKRGKICHSYHLQEL